MPIKFKCHCGQVLNVPSKMAGKTGKCPKCKEAIKIPVPKSQGAASQSSGQAKGKPSKAKAKSSAPAAAAAAPPPAAMDSLLEDAGLVQQTGPTCPKCMAAVKPGTVVCTACGYNTETGEQLTGFDAQSQGPEFENMYLQEAADNMVRDQKMDDRRAKAAMPWWVLMSFLIGAMTLCAAGVIIVDGKFGEPASPASFIGKVQRWPVFTTLGLTATITGLAITIFAHFSITAYGFTKSLGQGFACLFLPLLYSVIYGCMNWTNNKAPVKAIMMALVFIGLGVFLIVQGGGFNLVFNAFR